MTLKLPISILTTILLAPSALAWRVRLYKDANYEGTQATWSGPGGAGTACFGNVNPINNEISSLKFYAFNTERTSQCCITFYDSPSCQTKSGDWSPIAWCNDVSIANWKGTQYQDDISSFRTDCYSV
ncbi:hypothetical protein FE257_010115 [Aspergillus nanangensis]|uniref:Uncharacterized protein n=1 Tax=Aspergillus nanangensis TaxID=2582783 RepID=A0AAD4CL04_ASPNN|nr:hypothetical protein FE257_010115 [Aspergillus nanangensis]